MKKIAMLLGILVIFSMLSTTLVFAAGTTNAEITLVPSVTEVKVGETVTITVGIKGDTSGNLGLFGTPKIQVKWDTAYFEYVSGETDSSTFELASSTSLGETTTASGYVAFTQTINQADGEMPVPGDQTFGSITLKAIKATDTTTNISLRSQTDVRVDSITGGSMTTRIPVPETTTAEITIKAAGPTDIIVDGEDFSSATDGAYATDDVTSGNVKVGSTSIAMGEGGKIHTFFKKSDKALDAEKYGIDATINGKKFRFPGKVAVTANDEGEFLWAIKLVIPTGKFSDGVAASVTNITAYTID